MYLQVANYKVKIQSSLYYIIIMLPSCIQIDIGKNHSLKDLVMFHKKKIIALNNVLWVGGQLFKQQKMRSPWIFFIQHKQHSVIQNLCVFPTCIVLFAGVSFSRGSHSSETQYSFRQGFFNKFFSVYHFDVNISLS